MGCAADDELYSESGGTDDLELGEVVDEGSVQDPRAWTEALRCKPIPMLPALQSPEIIVSLDGLTLHLRDRAGGYDKVFAIGPGVLENGQSLTPTSDAAPQGVFYTGTNTTEMQDGRWGYFYPCRIWHEERGVRTPVFAGLPFIRLAGPPTVGYGIHGPIDQFTLPSGGALRRGHVSPYGSGRHAPDPSQGPLRDAPGPVLLPQWTAVDALVIARLLTVARDHSGPPRPSQASKDTCKWTGISRADDAVRRWR